jgi:hypothetical protein
MGDPAAVAPQAIERVKKRVRELIWRSAGRSP